MIFLVSTVLFLRIIFPVLTEVNNFDLEENVVQFPEPVPSISMGWEAPPGEFPWQLSLRLVNAQGSILGCGGVLVHAQWGVTAAQCTAGRATIVVRAGVTNLTTPEYMSDTTEYYSHPTYDSERPGHAQPNDIALIKLITPVDITEAARPIRVQPAADAFRDYGTDRVVVSGFGRLHTNGELVEVLHWVYLSLVSKESCQLLFNVFDEVVTDTSICAGPYNETAQSVCYGDSGGPLVHTSEDGEPILIGITSFVFGGEAGCHSGYPGVFVRPGPFHEWFTEITGIDFDPTNYNTTPRAYTSTEQTTEIPTTTYIPITTEDTATEPEETTTMETTTVPITTEDIATETEETTTIQTTTEQVTTELPVTIPPTEVPTTSEEVSEESLEESSEEDPDLKKLMKRLEVEVKVKVKMDKLKRKKKRVHHSL